MCSFLILNISSLQLIPINIIAYRSQYACLALAFFLILPWSDYGQTLTWLPLLCMLVGGAGILALIWMCGTLVWHVYTGRYLPGVSTPLTPSWSRATPPPPTPTT